MFIHFYVIFYIFTHCIYMFTLFLYIFIHFYTHFIFIFIHFTHSIYMFTHFIQAGVSLGMSVGQQVLHPFSFSTWWVNSIEISEEFPLYCQEWEIDQLLRFCMHNFIFYVRFGFLSQNIRPKYAPPRRDKQKVNWRGG